MSVSIDNVKHLNEILDDLKKYGTVTVDKDMCIICVVGDLEWENVGFEAKALDAMRDIPVRMISFGGSNYNISFLIRECDKKAALQSLSDALFNDCLLYTSYFSRFGSANEGSGQIDCRW